MQNKLRVPRDLTRVNRVSDDPRRGSVKQKALQIGMSSERLRLVNVRVTDEEAAQLKALADDSAGSVTALVRRWIRTNYEARFGRTPVVMPKR